jgi:hypothetical protein
MGGLKEQPDVDMSLIPDKVYGFLALLGSARGK